jgi:2-methylcitrate dehydratase PrpD
VSRPVSGSAWGGGFAGNENPWERRMTTIPLTQQLGDFVAGLGYEQIPNRALDWARTGFTDCVAVMLAGKDEPAVGIVDKVCRVGASGPSRLFLGTEQTTSERAALVNGTAAHVLDYDDVAQRGHPSAVLVPAILSLADELGSDGKRMLTAYVAGYEVWGELLYRDAGILHNKGWHPTTVLGTPAAAAACAVLLGLDAARTTNALAISTSMATGLVANFGTMTKSFQVGRAAQAGVLAARLAEAGMTGAEDAVEHPRGYLQAFSPAGEIDRERPSTIGKDWLIETNGLNLKKYPACYCVHRAGDAILDLLKTQSVAPDAVARIDTYLSETSFNVLRNTAPKTGLEGKFSIEFAVASALHAGRIGLGELTDGFVGRADVQATMAKVTRNPLPDEPGNDLPVAKADWVTLTLADGTVLESEKVAEARGGANLPLSVDDLWAKFKDCTAEMAGDDARRLFEALQQLDRVADSRHLKGTAASAAAMAK